jgi:hypothetical protein
MSDRRELDIGALAGLTALAPLTGDPRGGAIASLKQNFGISDAKPSMGFEDLLKPAATSAPAKPGMS